MAARAVSRASRPARRSCRSGRLAGSRAPTGGFAVYGRTDQLLAGLERAVDPDADGDVLDAARIAVVGVTERVRLVLRTGPWLSPSRAPAELDTLVVAPAGNEGPAGPDYGSIGGPGAARRRRSPSARQILRRETATVRVVVRSRPRCAARSGAPAGRRGSSARDADARRGEASSRRAAPDHAELCSHATSTTAGTASSPAAARCSRAPAGPIRRGPRCGARPGRRRSSSTALVPAGALGLDDRLDVPVVGLPSAAAASVRSALARGSDVTVSLGALGWQVNERLTSDCTVLVARSVLRRRRQARGGDAGVELVTADPGENDDRRPGYDGRSAARARGCACRWSGSCARTVRPGLDAAALGRAFSSAPRQSDRPAPTAAQGAGVVDR